MSQAEFLRRWASDTNFSTSPTGGVNGTPTKVDPGVAVSAEGLVPGIPAASRHLNYELNKIIETSRHHFTMLAIQQHPTGFTSDDAPFTIAATSQDSQDLPVIIGCTNSTGVALVHDMLPHVAGGAVASVTASVQGAAFKPSGRIVLVGANGNGNTYSDDGGATWNAGAALGGTGLDVLFNGTYSRFMAIISGNARYASDPSSAWTNVAVTGAGDFGMAKFTNGDVLIPTATSPIAFSISTNGGTSWAAAAGTVTSPSGYADRGFLCGGDGAYAYHAGVITGGATLRVSMTTDGTTWTTAANLTPPGGTFTGGGVARIRQCRDSGLLVIKAPCTDVDAYYASTDGINWSKPVTVEAATSVVNGFALARGKLFTMVGNTLYMSDGIGWD